MPKAAAPNSRLAVSAIFGAFAVLSFIGGIASNILANYVSPWFDNHKWVIWLACGVAIIVAIVAVVWEKGGDVEPESPSSAVQASGNRAVAISGDNSGAIITGDGNVIGAGIQGDVVARDKVTNIHYHAAAKERSASHQLPAPKLDFTGRETELAELKAHLRQNGQRGVAIAGAQGMGGVGKTELAVKLAAELKDEYPAAQIFFDLRGFSERPVTTAQALEHAIRALDPEMMGRLPETIEELQALYLARLNGQRALLVWDNVTDAAHVAPLTPPAGCAMIVTSRLHFTLPGLQACNLEALPPADARQLLQRIAARLTDAEADRFAELCGRLPLALRLTGSALAERPNIKPEKYAAQFAAKLAQMELPDEIEASFSLSYEFIGRAQPDGLQRWWRQLAVFPATFDDAAAAAVWQMASEGKVDDATGVLAELIRYSLVDYDAASERYELHDLARVFADSRMEEEEHAAAQLRHAQHFCGVLAEAGKLYLAGGEQVKAGLALFDHERSNIVVGMAWAAGQLEANQQAAELCVEYPNIGGYVINLRLHSREWIRWLEKQLAAARQLHQREMEGNALGNLGLAYTALCEPDKAIEFHEQDLAIRREIGNRHSEGGPLGNLGLAYANLGEPHKALEFYEQALLIDREIGDRRGEGATLNNLGNVYQDLGELHKAIEFYEQALVINREIGDRRAESYVLGNLGIAYKDLGAPRKAIEFLKQCLEVNREIADRYGEGAALWNTAQLLISLGAYGRAIECAEAALEILEEIEDPHAAMVREQLAEWRGQS